jgi:Helix-turn-helix domain of resolvase
MLPGKKRIGRPCAAGRAELRQLQRMTGEGATVTQTARILKISRSTALTQACARKQSIYVAYMCRLLA